MPSLPPNSESSVDGALRNSSDPSPHVSETVWIADTVYYTPTGLALLLGKTTRTLERWHARRKGPPRIKIGNLVLYPVAELPAWLALHQTAPVALTGSPSPEANCPAGLVTKAQANGPRNAHGHTGRSTGQRCTTSPGARKERADG